VELARVYLQSVVGFGGDVAVPGVLRRDLVHIKGRADIVEEVPHALVRLLGGAHCSSRFQAEFLLLFWCTINVSLREIKWRDFTTKVVLRADSGL
jgi:hypothetical protein